MIKYLIIRHFKNNHYYLRIGKRGTAEKTYQWEGLKDNADRFDQERAAQLITYIERLYPNDKISFEEVKVKF